MVDADAPMSPSQSSALAQVIGRLCRDHHIAQERVQIVPMARIARADETLMSMR
ncbi:hypothetical protein D3C83_299870 [compost metagenome]